MIKIEKQNTPLRKTTMANSEVGKHRSQIAKYCVGNGLDLGSAGAPCVPSAVQVELPNPYCPFLETEYPPQLRGKAEDLYWFKDGVLDYVMSSHLLEDWSEADQPKVLAEWGRVLKKGGYLIILVPEISMWHAIVAANKNRENLAHKHELKVGELSNMLKDDFEIIEDRMADDTDYTVLFVGKKK